MCFFKSDDCIVKEEEYKKRKEKDKAAELREKEKKKEEEEEGRKSLVLSWPLWFSTYLQNGHLAILLKKLKN